MGVGNLEAINTRQNGLGAISEQGAILARSSHLQTSTQRRNPRQSRYTARHSQTRSGALSLALPLTIALSICMARITRTAAVASMLIALASCNLYQQAPSTPQRPTVSFDTSTTAAGTVEIEAGVMADPGDFFDSPLTLKYGTSDDTDLFVGWSPLQVLEQPGSNGEGSSDLVIGARHRLWHGTDNRPSGALVLSAKLPAASANNGLGSGETDLRIAGVLNQQFGALNANLFYQYGALGVPGGTGTNSEHTVTLTVGIPVAEQWGAFAEVGGIFIPAQQTDMVFAIFGGAYSASPFLVLDAGLNVGLTNDAPDLQVFFGCTYNFGKLARLSRAGQ